MTKVVIALVGPIMGSVFFVNRHRSRAAGRVLRRSTYEGSFAAECLRIGTFAVRWECRMPFKRCHPNRIWVWLKIKREGQTVGFGPCFHLLPGFHFGTGCLNHSHLSLRFLSGKTKMLPEETSGGAMRVDVHFTQRAKGCSAFRHFSAGRSSLRKAAGSMWRPRCADQTFAWRPDAIHLARQGIATFLESLFWPGAIHKSPRRAARCKSSCATSGPSKASDYDALAALNLGPS